MNDYSKTGKLNLNHVKKNTVHILSDSPLLVQIDGDSYNCFDLLKVFTHGAQKYIQAQIAKKGVLS